MPTAKVGTSHVSLAALALLLSACAVATEDEPGRPSTGVGGSSSGSSGGSGGDVTGSGGNNSNPGSGGSSPGLGGSTGLGGNTASGGAIGTGGVTATGGTAAGTGGSGTTAGSCTNTVVATGSMGVIDDFEGVALSTIPLRDGRNGGWWLSAGPMTNTMPTANAVPTSVTGGNPGKAVHVVGTAAGWGLELAAALVPMGDCYNAAAYANGVRASMKGTGVVFIVAQTAAVNAAPEGQRNHFKVQLSLDATWMPKEARWTDFRQLGGWGVPTTFENTKITGVSIFAEPGSVDLWVDNLEFF